MSEKGIENEGRGVWRRRNAQSKSNRQLIRGAPWAVALNQGLQFGNSSDQTIGFDLNKKHNTHPRIDTENAPPTSIWFCLQPVDWHA